MPLLVSHGKLMTEVEADLQINNLGDIVHQPVPADQEPENLTYDSCKFLDFCI